MNEFMRRMVWAAGLRRPLLHLPLPLCAAMAQAMGAFLKKPPITMDNVLGVKQAQPVDQTAARQDWGYSPLGLDEGFRLTFSRND
ncbi:MAG: hypothetical protein M1457_04385 [bacterium]|nr:hypothetical protein [bacterium]